MAWKPRRIFVPFQFQYKEKRKQQESMDAKTYQECALRTMADQNIIRQRLYDMGSSMTQLENGIRGLTNEVGELTEITKRCIEYGKGPPDREHIKEEVGDCFWRLRQICDAIGLTFEECMQANIEKLRVRYPKEFSDINAQEENRDRAGEREAMTLNGLEAYVEEYQQTGSGFAEPPEDLPSEVRVSVDGGEARIVSPTLRKKPLNHSYTRYCSVCNIQPIHKSNTVGVCASCYSKNGEPKADTTNVDV